MARKSKYTPTLVTEILKLLEDGNTDADTYGLCGIGKDAFYEWINKKPEFAEAVTRARGVARQRAVDAWRSAMKETQTKSAKTVTISETRLDRKGEPYTYTRTTTEKQVSELAPDWRAAEAYLKRRDPDNWAETFIIKVNPEHAALLKKRGLSASDVWEQLMNNLAQVKDD